MKGRKKLSGQSLLEVIVALAVTTLVLTSLVSATVVSVRNARFAKNQSLATKYAQEALERVRIYRDQSDWDNIFKTESNCENPPNLSTLPLLYNRVINCSLDAGERRMTVEVTVSWTEAGRSHQGQLTTYLTKWD